MRAVDEPNLGETLPLSMEDFAEGEVASVVKAVEARRNPNRVFANNYGVPWRLAWLTRLCNKCWGDGKTAHDWSNAVVKCIHKKRHNGKP